MRSWLTYTAARLGLFAAAFGAVYLFGARSWIALVLAWLVSGLISYVLLSKLRDQMSAATVERLNKRRAPGVGDLLETGAAREDDLQAAPEADSTTAESPAPVDETDEDAPGEGKTEGRAGEARSTVGDA